MPIPIALIINMILKTLILYASRIYVFYHLFPYKKHGLICPCGCGETIARLRLFLFSLASFFKTPHLYLKTNVI